MVVQVNTIRLTFLCFCWISVVTGKECQFYADDGYDIHVLLCDEDCCGTMYDRQCCSWGETFDEHHATAVQIVGIVIGCLFLVAAVVSVIVCIVCCMRKSRGHDGQVVHQRGTAIVVTAGSAYPTGNVNQSYLYSTGHSPGQEAYISQQQPPAYPGTTGNQQVPA